MSTQDKVSVKIQQTHSCGQVIEQILHVDEADFTVKHDFPPFADSIKDATAFQLPPEFKRKIAFEGIYSKHEVSGMELKDHRLQCVKCGADMLFPDRKEPTA